jgi:hypothetical protein
MDERIRSDDVSNVDTAGTLPAGPHRITLDPLQGVSQAVASIALGMTFIIGSPATMLLIWVLWDSHFRDFRKVEIVLVAVCGFLGMLIILASAVFGLIFAIGAILAARRHHRPAALGVAGVLLNGFCLLLWIFIGILWAFAIGSRI